MTLVDEVTISCDVPSSAERAHSHPNTDVRQTLMAQMKLLEPSAPVYSTNQYFDGTIHEQIWPPAPLAVMHDWPASSDARLAR
eukprot:6213305-Pleurochrysis_carterae.AAC.4